MPILVKSGLVQLRYKEGKFVEKKPLLAGSGFFHLNHFNALVTVTLMPFI